MMLFNPRTHVQLKLAKVYFFPYLNSRFINSVFKVIKTQRKKENRQSCFINKQTADVLLQFLTFLHKTRTFKTQQCSFWDNLFVMSTQFMPSPPFSDKTLIPQH